MHTHEIIWRYIKVITIYLTFLAFAGVFIYKFANLGLGLKAEGLTTTDLLAILLAFFSVALAVFFYFKSSEESNRFYANSYEFTKAMSEMLGRIEAGFGERLRHIDEGYSHISQKFDDVLAEREMTVKKVEREQEDVNKIIQEKQQMIQSLLAKTDLQENEKKQILKAMSEKDEQLQSAQLQLENYQITLRKLEREMPKVEVPELPDPLLFVLSRLESEIGQTHFIHAPLPWLNNKLKPFIRDLSDLEQKVLKSSKIVDKDLDLTGQGRLILKDFSRARRERR